MKTLQNFWLKISLLVSIFLVAVNSIVDFDDLDDDVSKIIRGHPPVNATDFNFIAYLEVPGPTNISKPFRCVATIVDASTLFTSCHCLTAFNSKGEPEPRNVSGFRVMAGSIDIRSSAMQKRNMSAMYLNPNCHQNNTLLGYNGKRDSSLEYDIGHFTVDPPFKLTAQLQPAKFLPNKTSDDYNKFIKKLQRAQTNCTVQGWGYTRQLLNQNGTMDYFDEPPILQIADIGLMTPGQCTRKLCTIVDTWHWACRMDNDKFHMCGIPSQPPPNGSAECKGDSGSPIVCNGYPVGVTSWGMGCDQPLPSFFAKLSVHVDYLFSNYSVANETLWKYTGDPEDLLPLNVTDETTTVATPVSVKNETDEDPEVVPTQTEPDHVPEVAVNPTKPEPVLKESPPNGAVNQRISGLIITTIFLSSLLKVVKFSLNTNLLNSHRLPAR